MIKAKTLDNKYGTVKDILIAVDSNNSITYKSVKKIYNNLEETLYQRQENYTVNYYSEDGTSLLYTDTVSYGQDSIYLGEYQTKDGYEFSGWLPNPINVTRDLECYAQFISDDLIFYTTTIINGYIQELPGENSYTVSLAEIKSNPKMFRHFIANSPSQGEKFGYWVKNDDLIVCYSSTLPMYVEKENAAYSVVFVPENEEILYKGIVYFNSIVFLFDQNKTQCIVYGRVPDASYHMNKIGLIFTTNPSLAYRLNKTYVPGGVHGGSINSSSNATTYRYKWTKLYHQNEKCYVREYLNYTDPEGNEQEIYGDTIYQFYNKQIYPYQMPSNIHTVTYYSQDGQTIIFTDTVKDGDNSIYPVSLPTKASTSQYDYTFSGWASSTNQEAGTDNILTNITEDKVVYAAFQPVLKKFTVYFYNGETLLETVTGVPSGGTATYTGATPTSSQTGYIFSGWSPSNTNITADTSCYAQFVDEDMYESISDTWSEIIANVSNGTYSTKYQVGDTKKINLGTEGEVIMTIVGIDTDDLADNSGKAPITWISKQLLKTSHRMNPKKQSGTSGTGTLGGWAACEMRNYLINTIKPLLPSEVRNALKTVKKYSRIYNTSETAVNNVVSNDDIWIPSAYEVNFTGYETSGVTSSTAFPDNASRIKHKVSGSAAQWWLRSARGTYSFSIVNIDGSGSDFNVGGSRGVAVGFAI